MIASNDWCHIMSVAVISNLWHIHSRNGTIKIVTVIMLKIAVSRMTLGQVVAAVAVEVAATAAPPPEINSK